jgi:thiol:disulfide interchange protein DsbC
MKKLAALLLSALLSSSVYAGEKEIRQSLQSKIPNIGALEHIVKTPYAGLYEIVVGDQIFYTDAKGQYLFDGSVVDANSRSNLTEMRRQQLFTINFNELPLDLALKKVKGNGRRKLAIFADPNCGFCKRLDKELVKVSDVTIYLFLYPIFQGSDEVVRNVLCARDPVKAWDDLMLNGIAPDSATCQTNTGKVVALGQKMRITGTPNLIFGNGVQVPGYLPAEELEKRLSASGRQ